MKNQDLINALDKCIYHCNYCADACLDEEHVKHMVGCIRTNRVCAEVCSALKNILSGNYTDVEGLVKYCEQICRECAEECEKHNAQHCKDCAEACRECEKSCQKYLA